MCLVENFMHNLSNSTVLYLASIFETLSWTDLLGWVKRPYCALEAFVPLVEAYGKAVKAAGIQKRNRRKSFRPRRCCYVVG